MSHVSEKVFGRAGLRADHRMSGTTQQDSQCPSVRPFVLRLNYCGNKLRAICCRTEINRTRPAAHHPGRRCSDPIARGLADPRRFECTPVEERLSRTYLTSSSSAIESCYWYHYTRNTLDCDQSNYSSRIVFSHIPIEFVQT